MTAEFSIDAPIPDRIPNEGGRDPHGAMLCVRLATFLLLSVCLLAGCRTAAHQPVRLPVRHSVESDQLLVLSDVHLGREHPLVEDLIELRRQVTRTLDLPENSRQVVVYLFDNELHYRQYMETKYPGLPPRRAYFVGTPGELAVYTFWGTRIQEDLRHEFTHGLLHASLRSVPLWLDEGLAEYFEVVGPETGTVNVEYAERLATAVANGWRPDIERLERLRDISQMQRVDYQEAWGWAHFLLHSSPEMREVLLTYLRALRDDPHPEPLSRRIAGVQPTFGARYLSYVASLNTFGQAAAGF